jgi:acetyl-CoA carboxylase carboxyltransferase component
LSSEAGRDAAGQIGAADVMAARTKEDKDRFLARFVAAERGYIDDVVTPHFASPA